jgi:formylglycine-generating enzyme required for sulfatase activity
MKTTIYNLYFKTLLMKRLIALSICMMCLFTVSANNISIQKVSITDTNRIAKTASIRFSISWDNSWRDSINWDAAWIFIKYREPKDSVWHYRHMTLYASGNSAGTGSAAMKFAFPPDNKGVFYYRQAIGSGNIKMDSVKLVWNYGVDSVKAIDSVEVKVIATEMVYVPGGNFCLGDGNGTSRSQYSFQLKNAPNNFVTITDKWSPLINTFSGTSYTGTDDATLYNSGIRISGLSGLDITGDKVAAYPDFPTGYRSFYCMKYEVSQGQYADFLNTLSLRDSSLGYNYIYDTFRLKKVNVKYKTALQNLDPFYYSIPVDAQRNTILLDSNEVKYTVTRPDRAFGKGSNISYQSFSDWAALRPMSELEYEKACRGPLPPSFKSAIYNNNYNSDTTMSWSGFDWAWGNDTTLARTNSMNYGSTYNVLNYSGIENGTEIFSNYNIYKRSINPIYSVSSAIYKTVSGGDGGDGPYRVGIFATDSSSRISSGASYYGIMDFSKNMYQMVVNIGSSTSRTLSYKKHGDGMLNNYGNSDNSEFSNLSNNIVGGISYLYKQSAISDRSTYYSPQFSGFRSVRTAPTDN